MDFNVNESIKNTIKHKAELFNMETELLVERLSQFGIIVDSTVSKAKLVEMVLINSLSDNELWVYGLFLAGEIEQNEENSVFKGMLRDI